MSLFFLLPYLIERHDFLGLGEIVAGHADYGDSQTPDRTAEAENRQPLAAGSRAKGG